MEVQELKQMIKQNKIPNFLIFTGEEYYVQKMYIKQIAKVKKLEIRYIDSITDVWGRLNAKSLLSKQYLYVLLDDKELLTNEKIYSQIEDKLINNMLILVLTSSDKRLKMLKQYNSSIVEFKALNEAILKQYIKQEIELSDRSCEILMEICENNFGHCLLEIDKIKRNRWGYGEDSIDPNKVFQQMLKDGAIYVPPKDTLWDFIKAFLQDKPLLAYELYQDLKELNSPIFAILTNLYNNTKAVLQVQTCRSKDIAKSTGLTNWQIRNAKECVGRFSNEDLEYLMRLIQKVESGIKKGKIEESIAIDYIFTEFF